MAENQQLRNMLKVAFTYTETNCHVLFSLLPVIWHCGSVLSPGSAVMTSGQWQRIAHFTVSFGLQTEKDEDSIWDLRFFCTRRKQSKTLKYKKRKPEEFLTSLLPVALVSKLSSRLCAHKLYVVLQKCRAIFLYLRVEISVSIKRTTLPGFTVLQGLGQLCKFVSLLLVSMSLQYIDGCVCKIKICCYISVKLAQGRYKDFSFISALVSKMFLHLKSCSMPVSILGYIHMEGITCPQISENDLKIHVATYKIFSRLTVWVQCLKPCTPW